MAFHAVDDIDDAFEATRAFLLPFDAGQWLGLAVITFFLGGVGANFPSGDLGGGGGGVPDGPGGPSPSLPELDGALLAALLVVALLVVLLVVLFAVVGAVMEFALVESLRTEEVHVGRYARRHLGNGLRLFGFRLALALVALLVIAASLGVVVLLLGGPAALANLGSILVLVLLGLPLVLVVGVVYVVANGFTTTFVVPVMILDDRSVLGGWRRFWRTLRDEWTEYLVYVGLAFVLHLAVGVALAIVLGIVGVVLFVPLAVVGVVGLFAAGTVSPVALVAVAVVGILAFLVFLAVGAVVRVPVVAFFRYYALLVLGDTDADLDLIPERREAIRGESTEAADPS